MWVFNTAKKEATDSQNDTGCYYPSKRKKFLGYFMVELHVVYLC